jgi:sugar O-acyltransferase (sialic acid O-acetyltransferase NeuD family)
MCYPRHFIFLKIKNIKKMRKLAIIGYGSFTREILPSLKFKPLIFVDKEFITKENINFLLPLDLFDVSKNKGLITIANPLIKEKIVKNLPIETLFGKYIDKRSIFIDKSSIKINNGSIICAGSILTTNIILGEHSHINLNSTIGHDVKIGKYFTCSPGVNISGNCNIGERVYIGTNSSIRDGINICDDVIIGMGSSVVKDIIEPGIYIGNPAKKIQKC